MAGAPVGAADALAAAIKKAGNKGTQCGVSAFLDGLAPKDRTLFVDAAKRSTREVPHTALAEAAKMMGHKVTDGMWGHHRLGRCKCEK